MSDIPRPLVEPPRDWRFPVPVERTLRNGLNVLAFQRDGQHIAAAELVLDLPLTAEPAGVEGVATIAGRCLTEGTTSLPGSEFAAKVENLGAAIDGSAGLSATHVTLDVPAARLADGLVLLAQAVVEPELAEGDVERHQAIRLAEIDQTLANSDHRAALAFRAACVPERFRASRPAGGLAESVGAITRADVVALHNRYRPDGATLVLAGDFVGNPLDDAPTAFDGWTTASDAVAVHESPYGQAPRCVLIHRPGAVQADVRLGAFGLDRADPAYTDLAVACHALGGSFLSRLNRELREECGFTYGVHLVNHPMRTGGLLAVQGSFRTDVLVEALDRARRILDVATQPVTPDEVAKAVSNARGIAPLRYSTAEGLAGGVAALVAAGLDHRYVDAQADALRRVTPDSATGVITRLLRPEALTLVVVGDADALADPLTSSGWPLSVELS